MGNITILLGELRTGNALARSELFTQVYDELTRLARIRLPGGPQAHLDAPSLVHEAYLKLSEQQLPSLRDRRAETLHEALEELERIDNRAFRVVEMRYFAGLSIEEVAEVLNLSPMTVKRSWKSARAFLLKEMQG